MSDDKAARRTFPPTVTDDGVLRAGGCAIGPVEAGPNGEPLVVLPDRYRRRCQARGTSDVPINLEEAAAKVRAYLAEKEPPTGDI
jgi:hypothetical protein